MEKESGARLIDFLVYDFSIQMQSEVGLIEIIYQISFVTGVRLNVG
jgi:hypothetical protein